MKKPPELLTYSPLLLYLQYLRNLNVYKCEPSQFLHRQKESEISF